MRAALKRRSSLDLDARLDALRSAVDLGRGRLPDEALAEIDSLLNKSGERLRLGTELTVVALAGATGSGKSSLFNALAGAELAPVGVRRPTTAHAQACVFGEVRADELLDWMGIARRHQIADDERHGLVLLDLPDHDSHEVAHRLEVDRLVELVDLFVWITDPQKYADAALHEGYLRPLATHAPVTLVALNHIDKLSPNERRRCIADLRRLLEADGMKGVQVVATSARTGEGLDELRRVIDKRVAAKRMAAERLAADVDHAVAGMSSFCGGSPRGIDRRQRARLHATLADASGAPVVADAVARSHRRDAALATGWPVTRWLRRFRPDPLRRLHLGGSSGGRTSLQGTTPVQRAQAESAVRSLVETAAEGIPSPWPEVALQRAGESIDEVLAQLDAAISKTDLGERRPRWWTGAGALQVVVTVAAAVGFLWLAILFVLEWLQIPRPPTPEVNETIPWPTILLVGGLLLGFLLGGLFALFARAGAARRKARAEARLRREVEGVADELVVGPLEAELRAYEEFCRSIKLARSTRT